MTIPTGGFKATYRGEVIGWYNTAKEAEEAIALAVQADKDEEQAWRNTQK
jgi:hypothetical protein